MSKENEEHDDSQSSLEDYFGSTNAESRDSTSDAPTTEEDTDQNPDSQNESNIAPENDEETEEAETVVDMEVGVQDTPSDLPPSFLLSIDYAGNKKKAIARLYEPKTKKICCPASTTGRTAS